MNHPSKKVSRVRIGVIGCGVRISGVVKRLMQESPEITLTAVHDPDAAAVDRFRNELAPDVAVCASVEEL